jgi:hypothetical protein
MFLPNFGGETAVVLSACGWEDFSGRGSRSESFDLGIEF